MNNSRLLTYIHQNRVGLSFIILTWAIFFGRIFLAGNIFFLDDLKIIYYPLEKAYAEFQHNWQLPLWSNEFGFGHPLLAWGQLGFFTPLHVLLRLIGFHPLTLLQISIASYFLIGLLGFYALLRRRHFSEIPSAVGAIVFVFSGFSIGHLNHVNFYTGTMLLPWLVLAALRVVEHPVLRSNLTLAAIATAIVLSAQPQVVLLTFIAAAIIGACFLAEYATSWRHFGKVMGHTVIAGLLALCISSFAILPLWEFIPETERAEALSRQELVEFSYPPVHAVTLILPYFFGNHSTHWGAKGFQELAAFVGIIPLALAGAALTQRRRWRAEHAAGGLLVALSILLALGKYSPLYHYLVEKLIFSSFAIASRFVFFFDIGIALLATAGIEAFLHGSRRKKIWFGISALAFPLILLSPFLMRVWEEGVEQHELRYLWEHNDPHILLVAFSIIFLVIALVVHGKGGRRVQMYGLSILTVVTLLSYAWNYNPTTPATTAFAVSPLEEAVRAADQNLVPPRLYVRPLLLQKKPEDVAAVRYTDHISPTFSVYQPIPPTTEDFHCIYLPLEAALAGQEGEINVGAYRDPRQPPQQVISLSLHRVGQGARQHICFDEGIISPEATTWISLSADFNSNVTVPFIEQPDVEHQAYFVRTSDPTEAEWERSQKTVQTLIEPDLITSYDVEAALLERHTNVIAGASSARWIGALSIRPYRQFIEFFFANDQEPLDGDNIHAIERSRKLLDMAGITHLGQLLSSVNSDTMVEAGYKVVAEVPIGTKTARLYSNPNAYPHAFVVPSGIWKSAADETRHAMSATDFDPRNVVYLSGPKPPEKILTSSQPVNANAVIKRYEPTQVDIEVTSDQPAYVVLTDSTTPQWHTYIDGKESVQLVGNSIFKTAEIPTGTHIISFKYKSPAVMWARILTLSGVLIGSLLFFLPIIKPTPR